MNKKFKYLPDPRNKGNFKFLFVGILFVLVGFGIFFIAQKNLAVANPDLSFANSRYGLLFLIIGLFLIFVYAIFPKSIQSWLAKLAILETNLIIKNPFKTLSQISIFDINSVALRYEVCAISLSVMRGPINARYFIRQWGYLIKLKSGQIYEIKQNIGNFQDFIKELQNTNSSIHQSLELEEQSKTQAVEDFKKTPSFGLSGIVWDKDL